MAAERIDVVFIRKSTDAQKDQEQVENVERLLAERKVFVPKRQWYGGQGRRAKHLENEAFQAVIGMVEAGQVGTVYVETFDRFGTDDHSDLLGYIKKFRRSRTKLIGLTEGRDWTDTSFENEIMLLFSSRRSREELNKLSERVMRTKINLASRGQWVGGSAPFGLDKVCTSHLGTPLWRYVHTSRLLGDVYHPTPSGDWVLARREVSSPKKGVKEDVIRLAPSIDQERVKLVQDVFDWFDTQNVPVRRLAVALTKQGRTLYGQPFDHADVLRMLRQPAYKGTYLFGKSDTAQYRAWDRKKKLVVAADVDEDRPRTIPAEECLQTPNAWTGIVDPAVWDRVNAKLDDPTRKRITAPTNAVYYLKGILVCGHCGREMTSRSHGKKGRTVYGYQCSSNLIGRNRGTTPECGFHFITAEVAEMIVLAKLTRDVAVPTSDDLGRQLDLLGDQAEADATGALLAVAEGTAAYLDHLAEQTGGVLPTEAEREALGWAVDIALLNGPEADRVRVERPDGKAVSVRTVRDAINRLEKRKVDLANKTLARLQAEHKKLTRAFVLGLEDMTPAMREATRGEIAENEAEQKKWSALTTSLFDRVDELVRKVNERAEAIRELVEQLPGTEDRQRGEAIRRLVKAVTFFWDARPGPKKVRHALRPRDTKLVYQDCKLGAGC